ncbi:hypothetical protein [Pantoea sp. GM01]|uniref:hypothetical protein n=1 Tax=Pantoea sp. GM01 TaxID=1144320 RepID=UPI0002712549|nr:hypothetical protein [Pantoea sp. GM01]EJL90829.1 hypothetical protein PMI17_01368 [Pantoea sp. GM01]
MRYFNFLLLALISFNSHAAMFSISENARSIDGVDYYYLNVIDGNKAKTIPIPLEGNATSINISGDYDFICPWGKVRGVRLSMSSSTGDGSMQINEFYYFNENLKKVFAKYYTTFNQRDFVYPISLQSSVCDGGGKENNNLIEQVISNGPFKVKGVDKTFVKIVSSDDLKLLIEKEDGEQILSTFGLKWGVFPDSKTLFFMSVGSQMNLVSLIGWDKSANNTCYRIVAFSYDKKGYFKNNELISNDPKLAGCDADSNPFHYKNAGSIRNYINNINVK